MILESMLSARASSDQFSQPIAEDGRITFFLEVRISFLIIIPARLVSVFNNSERFIVLSMLPRSIFCAGASNLIDTGVNREA